MDPQQPRGLWPVGIIPSNDGKIQTVKVTSTEKRYVRPVARLVILLQVESASEN